MRLGTVIGRVTLSVTVPALEGARWLIVSPFTREHFQRGSETPPGMSKDPSLVVYDDLGGATGRRWIRDLESDFPRGGLDPGITRRRRRHRLRSVALAYDPNLDRRSPARGDTRLHRATLGPRTRHERR